MYAIFHQCRISFCQGPSICPRVVVERRKPKLVSVGKPIDLWSGLCAVEEPLRCLLNSLLAECLSEFAHVVFERGLYWFGVARA
jgi:hypothetical protein